MQPLAPSPIGSSGRRFAAVMNPSRDMLMSKNTLPMAASRIDWPDHMAAARIAQEIRRRLNP